eukprot:1154968-Pelagomonas_calceolata.AAC.7
MVSDRFCVHAARMQAQRFSCWRACRRTILVAVDPAACVIEGCGLPCKGLLSLRAVEYHVRVWCLLGLWILRLVSEGCGLPCKGLLSLRAAEYHVRVRCL